MDDDVAGWVKLAKYDLDTAGDMMKCRRYLYVLFSCQQAMEKMLKALVVQRTQIFPPKIHDLVKLAEMANLTLGKETKKFMTKLSYYYVETRYPVVFYNIIEEVDEDLANEYLRTTKEVFKWLEQKLLQKK